MQIVSLAGFCACLLATSGHAESVECRVATVTSVRASVRSGPGRDFYITDRIDRDTVVDIYGEEEGGWLAIRPPASSFSWVAASSVRDTSESGISEIVAPDVVAWIGSSTTAPRNHQWQVRLKLGELVEVLGQSEIKLVEDTITRRCLKIAPPAGEFRWIHESDVEFSDDSKDASEREGGIRVAEYQVPVGSKKGDVEPAARFVTPRKPGEASNPRMASRDTTPRKMPPRYTKALGDADLDELNLELSLMVAQDPDMWDLTPLKVAAERQTELAKTPLDRARAKRLLERVREFESLQNRRRQLAILGRETDESAANDRDNSLVAAPPRRPRNEKSTSEEPRDPVTPLDNNEPAMGTDPRFDATGWLVPVHSTKRVAPPYALIDDEGNVIQYVSPAPGLNLHRYLRKKVGIYGEQNFQASLKASHVVAERIVDLKKR